MANLPFFKFDSDAWLTGKIQLLKTLEKGIFIDIVSRIWHENGALKNDEILHRLLRVEKGTLLESLQAFFDLHIMYEENGFLRVKFIDEQLKDRLEYIEKQREIGRSGGRPQKGTKPKNKQKEERRENKESISCEIPKKPPTLSEYPSTIDEIFEIASRPTCGMAITQEQADAYLTNRLASDWVDGQRRKISVSGVTYDLKKWLMRDKAEAERRGNDDGNRKTFDF